jgi:uncharacterized RDD family membrane protein YckC
MWTIILTSRVAVFTALFPYLPMVALFIRGMTLDGAWYGLKYYLIPDVQRLLNKKSWIQAAGRNISREKKILFLKILLNLRTCSMGIWYRLGYYSSFIKL